MFENIKNIYNSTILCIKYPFLYQRNRYTDEHYRNLWIHNRLWDIRKKYLLNFSINILTKENYEKKIENINEETSATTEIGKTIEYNNNTISIKHNDDCFTICINGKQYTYKIENYLGNKCLIKEDVKDIFLVKRTSQNFVGEYIYKPSIWILLNDDIGQSQRYYTFKSISLYSKPSKKYESILLKKANDFLKIFHILPSRTELGGMEDGWRKRFGEDICKEIRNSLLLTYVKTENPTNIFDKIKCYYKGIKHLYAYRIEQIKEKFGELRWYAYGDTKDTLNIIHKYQDISGKTCIICGKDAKYMSTGWISPFCEDHKPERCVKLKDKDKYYEENCN